jgi:hypothetical protein
MELRRARIRLVLAAGILTLTAPILSGCGSDALTNSANPQSGPGTSRNTAAPSSGGTGAGLAGAVSKLSLISQDGCQTEPPERIYPDCERFLAEVRSSASTIRNGAGALPNGQAVQASAAGVLASADAYDRDGCGGPYASGAANAGRCAADLRQVRAGVTALLQQTSGVG